MHVPPLPRWAGFALLAAGALLMSRSDPSAAILTGALSTAGSAVHLDWFLLAGLACMLGGGLLVQITWRKRHG